MRLRHQKRFLPGRGQLRSWFPFPRALLVGTALCLLWIAGERTSNARARLFQEPEQPQAAENFAELSEAEQLERRGDIYMARKYYAEAVETYKRLVELQPRTAFFYNKLGIAYHQMMEFGAARRFYQKAVELNPQYAQAINNLGAVEYARKKYRDAILTYLKALKISPGDAVIYSNLGTAYFAYERYEYAMDSYRYALLLNPMIFERRGRTGSIVHQGEAENTAAFNFYLAKTYASLGNAEETLRYLLKAWEEGFPDLRKALEDKVFEFLDEDPRFVEFLTLLEPPPSPNSN